MGNQVQTAKRPAALLPSSSFEWLPNGNINRRVSFHQYTAELLLAQGLLNYWGEACPVDSVGVYQLSIICLQQASMRHGLCFGPI